MSCRVSASTGDDALSEAMEASVDEGVARPGFPVFPGRLSRWWELKYEEQQSLNEWVERNRPQSRS